jgi:hypothetical protein
MCGVKSPGTVNVMSNQCVKREMIMWIMSLLVMEVYKRYIHTVGMLVGMAVFLRTTF